MGILASGILTGLIRILIPAANVMASWIARSLPLTVSCTGRGIPADRIPMLRRYLRGWGGAETRISCRRIVGLPVARLRGIIHSHALQSSRHPARLQPG